MAFLAPAVWEVRTTGSDANGGAFDPTSGTPGTDYSQQTAAQIAYTDMVIAITTTNFTSAANPVTAAIVGNFINVTGGVNFTVQRVQVISVAGNVATCDKSLGVAAAVGGTGNLGGCLATIGKAAGLVVAGNTTYIKATATYSTTALINLSTAGSAGKPIRWIGYTTTRTDGGFVTASNDASSRVFNVGTLNWLFNIIADNSVSDGFLTTGNYAWFDNCKGTNCPGIYFYNDGGPATFTRCAVVGQSTGTRAFYDDNGQVVYIGCVANGNTFKGFETAANSATYEFCISANNSGGTSTGFATAGTLAVYRNCLAYSNGSDGLVSSSATLLPVVQNCIFVSNGGYGVNSTVAAWTSGWFNYNAFYNNTSGERNQLPTGANDVTLTADPFTNGAGGDFSLNNTTGGGMSLRATGYPGAFTGISTTGYLDIGSVQHRGPYQMLVHPGMAGGARG